MSNLHKKLGMRIKKLRKMKGLTQSELAEKTGLSDNFIGIIERGKGGGTLKTLHKIANVLGVEIKELFEFDVSSRDTNEVLKKFKKYLENKPHNKIKAIYQIAKIIDENFY